MLPDLLPFLIDHGYAVLFFCVLAEQAGAPIPATPVLIAIGAMAGLGRVPLLPAAALSLLACSISDSLWYWLGRRRGASVLRFLCAISLEPDSCINTTQRTFRKFGAYSLLFAKFVPGLSTAAPPLAGVTGMPYSRFLLADGAGSLLWSGTFFALGWVFRHQMEYIADRVMAFGSRAGIFVALLLAAYMFFKFWQRQRFIRTLRIARISPEDVLARIQDGEDVTIVDLRDRHAMETSGQVIRGAVWYDRELLLAGGTLDIPLDREVILYCS